MATTSVGAVWFAEAARQLAVVSRGRGLEAVAFRSPPRDPGLDRSLRRGKGGAVVSVRLAGRRADEVLDDMVDGILAANRTDDPAHRAALVATVAHLAGPLESAAS